MKKYRGRIRFNGRNCFFYAKQIHSTIHKNYRRQHRLILLASVLAVCLLGSVIFALQFSPATYSIQTSFLSCQSTEAASNSKIIVIDAGHGGSDPGAVWNDIYEKDINFAIAAKLQKLLQEAGHTVIMTRTGDTSVYLRERVEQAEYSDADVFVSIHQNALENDTTTSGVEVYCNAFANQSSPVLAAAIHESLLHETGASDLGMETASRFFVVRRCSVPACLVETGFLTSAEERQLLLSEDYQQKIAVGIANGIEAYFQTGAVIA